MPLPADPWSAGIMAVGSVAGAAFQKTPNQSSANQQSSFDSSGWNVNVNSNGAHQTSSGGGKSLGAGGLQLGSLLNSPLVIVGLGIAIYYVWKK